MKKALLVAEKPSVAKAIEEAYGKIREKLDYDITFAAAAGHLVGFVEPDEYQDKNWGRPWIQEVLPMIPDRWQTKVINPKFYNSIKEKYKSGNYDFIINAGDAGREGQLIQALIYDKMNIKEPVMRLWASDLTEETLGGALLSLIPNENFKNLEDASYMRAESDWLMGMNFSRAASLSLGRNTRIGRVMTPVLYMLVQREREIKNFKPEHYVEFIATFVLPDGRGEYKGILLNEEKNTEFFKTYNKESINKAAIDNIRQAVSRTGSIGVVMSAEKKEEVSKAPALYNLTDLQKACAGRYTPAQTLEAAQSLYEKKYLSYPRTDARHLCSNQKNEIKGILAKSAALYGVTDLVDPDKVLSTKRYVNDSKVGDHPALTPTADMPDRENLTAVERLVYDVVSKRFISIFMPECITEKTEVYTEVETDGKKYLFKTTGSHVKQKGYKAIYADNIREETLPDIHKDDRCMINGCGIANKITNPPKHYTDASILTAMETAGKTIDDKQLEKVLNDCGGLGTPATRAAELEKLLECGYMIREKSGLIPSGEGTELIEHIEKQNESILKPDLTAMWEDKLRDIEDGKLSRESYYSAITKYVAACTEDFKKLPHIGPYRQKIGTCPKCGKDFVDTSRGYCCEGYLEEGKVCDVTIPKKLGGRIISRREAVTIITGGTTEKKQFTWKSGKQSIVGLKFGEDFKLMLANEPVGRCPVCGGSIMAGKYQYYCENAIGESPKCSFKLNNHCGQTGVPEQWMKEILEGGCTRKEHTITWKSGKTSSCRVIFEQNDEGKWWFTFKKNAREQIEGKCPRCGNTVYKNGIYYECEDYRRPGASDYADGGCDFRIGTYFNRATPISEAELAKMLAKPGENVYIKKRITSKNYRGEIEMCIKYGDMRNNGNIGWHYDIKFPPREKK